MGHREAMRARWIKTISVPAEWRGTDSAVRGTAEPRHGTQTSGGDWAPASAGAQGGASVPAKAGTQTSGGDWAPASAGAQAGLYVPPTLIRLERIEDLRKEWFGPLLHVATWKAGRLAETVERINGSGFGLTMGLHSRIARAAEAVEEEATVGNLYVNRSMIGAIVGSQPFGGEGQSGTGPKAGGPHYLPRFCAERVTSTDTTSAGGNATLLSLEDVGL
jgi:delta 1-pyrroline-5-carboxylate dehydrogenase